MKNFLCILFGAVLLTGATFPISVSGETKKSRKEQKTELRKSFDQKASKKARQAAKKLTQEGWMPIGSGRPLENQLERVWMYEEENDDFEQEYVVEAGVGIAKTLAAAKLTANKNAGLAIARSLESHYASIGEGGMSNKVNSDDMMYTEQNETDVYKDIVDKSLKNTITLSERYRITKNGAYEVHVTKAVKIITPTQEEKDNWMKESKEKQEKLHKQLSDKLEN